MNFFRSRNSCLATSRTISWTNYNRPGESKWRKREVRDCCGATGLGSSILSVIGAAWAMRMLDGGCPSRPRLSVAGRGAPGDAGNAETARMGATAGMAPIRGAVAILAVGIIGLTAVRVRQCTWWWRVKHVVWLFCFGGLQLVSQRG